MQRRGKAQLRIASPGRHGPLTGSDVAEKHSRLNQRSLGVTNRIWLIVALFVLILLLTHYAVPDNLPASTRVYSNAHLKSKNYFQVQQQSDPLPNPFEFCPVYGPEDVVGSKHGSVKLGQSRLHLGSGARIQRLLNRALAGHPITISVIGGSVSACHGAGDDPVAPKCYPSLFFQWWNRVFPHPATELTNGAMRRTSSEYFGYCNAHHLPDQTDLVVIELDTDDPPERETLQHFEILVRSLLLRPEEPAVVLLGHFSRQHYHAHGYAGPDHWHSVVAQFYDVPHVSIKPFLIPDYLRDRDSINKYFVDPVLPSSLGHEILSEALIAYFQSQICIAWAVANGQSFDSVPLLTPEVVAGAAEGIAPLGGIGQRKDLPPVLVEGKEEELEPVVPADEDVQKSRSKQKQKIDNKLLHAVAHFSQLQVPNDRIHTWPGSADKQFEEIAPYCVSANNLINPLPLSLFSGSGWSAFHPPTSNGPNLHTMAHYFYCTQPTSKIRIPILVGAGDVGVYYMKEPVSQVGEGSSVSCWVDDNVKGARTIENAANIGEAVSALEVIDHFVARGSHFVECMLLGEEGVAVPSFKIMGIFAT